MTKQKLSNVLFAVLSITTCLWMAAYLGVLPFCTLPTLDFNISLVGQIANFKGNAPLDFSFTGMMYPYGSKVNEGFAIYFLARIFYGAGISAIDSLTLTYFLLFALGYFAMIFVIYKISQNVIISILLSISYFMSPFVSLNSGIPQMYLGVMLMPLQVMIDILLLEYMQRSLEKNNKRQSILLFVVAFSSRFFMAAVGWYTAVISAVLSCLFFLLLLFGEKENLWIRVKQYWLYILMPWFLGMLLIMIQTPKGTSSFIYKMEYFYASSLDIITLFLPTGAYKISDLIPLLRNYLANNDLALIGGDIQYCYLGFSTLIAMGIILFQKEDKKKKEKICLIISAVALLVLAIGPGFRFFEMISTQDINGYASYFMEKEKVVSLPWSFLYRIFPLKSMRTVYRWFYGTRMATFLMIALAAKKLACEHSKKRFFAAAKKVIAYIMVLLCLFENIPYSMSWNLMDSYKTMSYDTLKDVYPSEICDELKEVLTKDNALVTISTYDFSNNGILTPFLVSEWGIRTYAGCGDKAIETAELLYPKAVWKLQKAATSDDIITYTEQISRQKLCDYIILPFYSLRDAGYYWPMPEEMQERLMTIAEEVEKGLYGKYPIVKTAHYMVIDLTEERAVGSYDINTKNTTQGIVKDTNFGDDRNSILINKSDVNLQVSTADKRNLYILGYVKAVQRSVEFQIYACDSAGNVIGQMTEAVEASGDYEKYEREIELPQNTDSIMIDVVSEDSKAVIDSLHATVY